MRVSVPHVLIVDDEASIRLALATALTGTYVVWEAATGEEACRVLRTHPIAAIVLDVVLGQEHGLDLIEQFRALSRARIVILTGYSTEELAIRAVRAQVNDYLKKPVNIDDLRTTIARVVPPTARPTDPVERLRLHLEEHPRKDRTLCDLASQLAVSEDHLRRLFRAVYGKTPQQYLAERRIRHAAELLRKTPRGVKEVATAVGWSNVAHFYKLFKRSVGLTPAGYRARHGPRASLEAADPGSSEEA